MAPAADLGPGGGRAGGALAELNTLLPAYRDGLVEVAKSLQDRVNTQHAAGFDQDGAAGKDLLAVGADGRTTLLTRDPRRLAASDTAGTGSGDKGGANASRMGELTTVAGGPDELYRTTVVGLGVQAQATNRRVDIQANILGQLDAAREADSGVNMDEEMTNMLAYQRAYEGAARFMTAVDQMLETLINRTGTVGR